MLSCESQKIPIQKGDRFMAEKRVKIIFTGKLARALLRRGYRIIDVKPNRDFPERTVFIFEDTPDLKQVVRELTST